MFAIILPVAVSPALVVLLIGDYRARKLGTMSPASSSFARRNGGTSPNADRTIWQTVRFYWTRLNGFGLLLMGFGFALLLSPITLNTTAKGGYTNRKCHQPALC